jgi:hypothetical protein
MWCSVVSQRARMTTKIDEWICSRERLRNVLLTMISGKPPFPTHRDQAVKNSPENFRCIGFPDITKHCGFTLSVKQRLFIKLGLFIVKLFMNEI